MPSSSPTSTGGRAAAPLAGDRRSVPAPPLLPVRRQDDSVTRSPRSRHHATRAGGDRSSSTAPAPSALDLLGTDADYLGWATAAATTPPPGTRRSVGPEAIERFEALVLPESSLAEGPTVTTAPPSDQGVERSLGSPSCS